jgi:hypothetical protein
VTRSVATIAQQSLRRLGVRVVPVGDSPTLTETVPAATIATQALVELGVIAADETPLAADQALMLDRVASVHASLDAQGTVFWTQDAIPRAFAEEYTKLTAAFGSTAFGKTADPAVVKLLEGRVRAGVMVLSADDNAQQAVQAIHDDLVSRGIARWTVFDIPEAVADSYSVLAAQRLAPLFGGQANPNEARQAEVSIFRYVALPTSGEAMTATYF